MPGNNRRSNLAVWDRLTNGWKYTKMFSLDNIADLIAEFTSDGAAKKDSWKFYDWLYRRCKSYAKRK